MQARKPHPVPDESARSLLNRYAQPTAVEGYQRQVAHDQEDREQAHKCHRVEVIERKPQVDPEVAKDRPRPGKHVPAVPAVVNPAEVGAGSGETEARQSKEPATDEANSPGDNGMNEHQG